MSTVFRFCEQVTMTTYYLDADLRISRTSDDHFFVFTRGLRG
jgi:hypothetical protein